VVSRLTPIHDISEKNAAAMISLCIFLQFTSIIIVIIIYGIVGLMVVMIMIHSMVAARVTNSKDLLLLFFDNKRSAG
jgi:hypothetical protein